ncbi:unnamed protein product [Urochloa humidicola]
MARPPEELVRRGGGACARPACALSAGSPRARARHRHPPGVEQLAGAERPHPPIELQEEHAGAEQLAGGFGGRNSRARLVEVEGLRCARRIQAERLLEETAEYNPSVSIASAWENGTCPSSREATPAPSVG